MINLAKYMAITGMKKAGKTTTIEFLVEKMRSKYKIGTVKIAFKDVSIDVEQEHYDIVRMRKKKPTKTLFKSKSETAIFFNE